MYRFAMFFWFRLRRVRLGIIFMARRMVLVSAFLMLASLHAAQGATQSVVYSFDGSLGAIPHGPLLQATDGLLYGTAEYGPYTPNNSYTSGSVFRVNRDSNGQFSPGSSITVIYSFSTVGADGTNADGAHPACALLQMGTGANGAPILYGTATDGGTNAHGTVFELRPDAASPTGYTENTVHSFDSTGGAPRPTLTLASDGNLYGATLIGASIYGTVFQLTPSGAFSTIYTFTDLSSDNPQYGVVQASDGNLYGVTRGDAGTHYGYIYRVSPSGTFSVVHTFLSGQTDGALPNGMIVGKDGNLYGTTQNGGLHGYGTVFKCTLNGVVTLLHSFAGIDGMYPQAVLTQGLDGNLYGTATYGGTVAAGSSAAGTVFELSPDESGAFTPASPFAVTYSFPVTNGNAANLKEPDAGVVQGRDGYIYGVTPYGGDGVDVFGHPDDYGGVYRIEPPPSYQAGLTFFSSPYDYPGVDLDSLVGYAGVKLAVWNPTTMSYALTPNAPADQIRLGVGYWARFPQSVQLSPGTPAPLNQPFTISLSAGWNQIGDPFLVSIPLSSVTFNNGAMTYAQATSGTSPTIGSIYSYNAAKGQYVVDRGSLVPQQGYWIWASVGTTMQITPP
jgi:uncharacterized repeat protein (TIGR03803 family)